MVKKSDSEKIRELADLLNETGLSEIEIESGDTRIRVARGGVSISAAPIAQTAAPFSAAAIDDAPADLSTNPGALISPMVGTAYSSPEPGKERFIKLNSSVSIGDTLLIIEAMKVMNSITAHKSGKIVHIGFEDGQPIEFNQLLVVIE